MRKLREASAFIKISVNAKISKNQQKINFLQLWGHLKTLKFLINFCTILEVLRRSNFLLPLCSKKKTKKFFTPPYCVVVLSSQILFFQISYGSEHLNFCHEVLFRSEKTENEFLLQLNVKNVDTLLSETQFLYNKNFVDVLRAECEKNFLKSSRAQKPRQKAVT